MRICRTCAPLCVMMYSIKLIPVDVVMLSRAREC